MIRRLVVKGGRARESVVKGSAAYAKALRLAGRKSPDFQQALQFLKLAVSHGDSRAEYALATWYLHGRAVEKAPHRAIPLLKRAARSGHREAQFDLAVSFERGNGVEKDARKAYLLYLQSALTGDVDAGFEVGRCLFHGLGVERDRAAGRLWLKARPERRSKGART